MDKAGPDSEQAGRHLCWHCSQATGGGPFCEHCSKIQPAGPGTDHFQFMGLPRRLRIDVEDLERRFYALSRTFHPDFYQNAESYEQRVSLENSAILNRAYRDLREPFARTEYLVKLVSGSDIELVPAPPDEFLEQVFEFNERLEEFQSEDDEESKKRLGAELEEDQGRFEEQEAALRSRLDELFGRWDAAADAGGKGEGGEDPAETLEDLKTVLSQRKYIQNAVRDITEALHCHTSV